MHLELIVPGLLAAAELPRLPALELLAARGRAARVTRDTLERRLGAAFGVADAPLAAGALTLLAGGRDPGDGFWLRADPLHLEVGAHGATITPPAALEVTRDEADALVTALNKHFGGDFAWLAPRPHCWCVSTAAALRVEADGPVEGHSGEAGVLAQGAASPGTQAFVTEVQMLLHRHPVNQARERRSAPTLNSLWLWGGGSLPRSAAGPWQSVLADDPVAAGLAKLARLHLDALPPDAGHWLAQGAREGHHLIVLDALRAHRDGPGAIEALEARWFAPLLAALRADRIGMLTLDVPDAGQRWETTRADLRRFWRRTRPLSAAP